MFHFLGRITETQRVQLEFEPRSTQLQFSVLSILAMKKQGYK